jgi:transcription termination/antitermination protein NusG
MAEEVQQFEELEADDLPAHEPASDEAAGESRLPEAEAAALDAEAELAEPEDALDEPEEMLDEAAEEEQDESEDALDEAVEEEQDGDEKAAEGDAEAAVVAAPEDDRSWFVIHCYSGYENKVRHNLEQRIDTMGMKDKIFDVVVPTEEEIEVREGKRRTVERRVFPGYILVQMLMDEDSWYVVRNTPGVTGFVGMGNTPTPLRPEEVSQIMKRMEAESPKVKVTFKPGQKVRIIDGPFNDFIGTVADLDMARAKVRVMVSFFGRETPVELDFLQVEKA